MPKKIKTLISNLMYILDSKQRVEFISVLVMIVFTSFMEMLGVTAVLPLIEMILNSEVISSNRFLDFCYKTGGFSNTESFLIFFAVALMVLYFLKNFFILASYNFQHKFTFKNQKLLASKMLSRDLRQPYKFHLNHSSAELIRSINTDIPMMFQGVLAIMGMFAEVLVCALLGSFLLITDSTTTLIVTAVLGITAILLAPKYKQYLKDIGEEDRKSALGIVKWLQQSFGGLKETKIMHREAFFLDMFNGQYGKWADMEQFYRNLQMFPKPIMEFVCVSAVMGAIIIKLLSGAPVVTFISSIAAFAMAAFRLLPSFNRITGYIGAILFYYPAFNAVYLSMKQMEDEDDLEEDFTKDNYSPLPFNEEISFRDLSFRYPTGEQNVLEKVCLTIPKNASVAFIGPSGAGKTTLADIFLGVLKPSGGTIYIDGQDEFLNLRSWQKNVGYIPQTIYLMDDTIRNNILYGGIADENDEKIYRAVKEAQLADFIDSLPDGLDTYIGEGGMRLSGGQRQRIGIARALYDDPQVLVLDEATSALDNETEKTVMEAINLFSGNKTLIIIAHRLSTVANCDYKYEIKEKKVKLLTEEDFRERLKYNIDNNAEAGT